MMMPLPPPPPPQLSQRSVAVSPLVSPFSLTAAVFVFGGYPQVKWDDAVESLKRLILTETPFDEIRPISLWLLGRKVLGKEYRFL